MECPLFFLFLHSFGQLTPEKAVCERERMGSIVATGSELDQSLVVSVCDQGEMVTEASPLFWSKSDRLSSLVTRLLGDKTIKQLDPQPASKYSLSWLWSFSGNPLFFGDR